MSSHPKTPSAQGPSEADAWHTAIFDSALDCIVTMDREGRVLEINPAAERMFGYRSDEARGREMAELIIPERYRERHRAGLKRHLETGQTNMIGRRIEVYGTHADGTEIPLELTVTKLHREGAPVFTAFMRDLTERRRAEKAAKQSEAKLHLLVDRSSDAILLVDGNRFVDCNPAAVTMLGCESRDEVLALGPATASPSYQPDGRLSSEKAAEMLSLSMSSGSHRFEWMHRRRDGSCFPAEVLLTTVQLGDHPLVYGVVRDITARKQAEEALRASEEGYRAIFNFSNDAILVHDLETGGLVGVNDKACEMFACSRAQLVSAGLAAIASAGEPFTVERLQEKVRAAALGEPQTFEWMGKSDTGQGFWLELNMRRATIGGQERVLATARDITELKRAEEETRARTARALRYQAALLELHKSHQPNLLAALREITTKAADTLETNRVTILMYNAERTAIVTADLYERDTDRHSSGTVLYASDYPRYFQALESNRTIAAHDARSDPATSEFRDNYLAPLGIMSMLDVPVRLKGKTVGVICHEQIGRLRQWTLEERDFAASVSDVISLTLEAAERHKAEDALQRAKDELEVRVQLRTAELNQANLDLQEQIAERRKSEERAEEANVAKSEFLSRMSHELRTPMNSILGFAQVLLRKQLPADQQKHVQHILRAGRHLLELINEVLDISRIEAGHLSLSSEPLRFATVLQESMNLVVHMATERNVTIDDGLVPSDVFVKADRQRLTQVMVNVLSNAVKYNRSGGTVTVSASIDGGIARLNVTDTGRGIAPEKLDRLFNPFERLGAENTGIEGTGLGLALSKRLVQAMGGTMGVDSSVNVGTTIWVELPQAETPQVRPGRPSESGGTTTSLADDGVKYTALYVEDNLANLSLIESIFGEIPGLRLLTATEGEAGIQKAMEIVPDLVLLDMHLPDIPGEQVLARMKGSPKTSHIPVIVVSADATASHINAVLAAGAAHYFTKPLDVDRFLKVVKAALPAAVSDSCT